MGILRDRKVLSMGFGVFSMGELHVYELSNYFMKSEKMISYILAFSSINRAKYHSLHFLLIYRQ